MSVEPAGGDEGRTSTLVLAREKAKKLRAAGDKLGLSVGDIRRRLTLLSFVVPGLLFAPFVAMWAELNLHREPGPFVAGFLIGVPIVTNLLIRVAERVFRSRHAPDQAYRQVLDKCLELGLMPAPIEAALDQALEAYFALRKLGEEPDWIRVGYPMDDHLRRASERVVELMEWGRRLAFIGERLEKTRGEAQNTPEFCETQTHYLAQCAQIASAAAAFSRVEAKVTLAYAALCASAARDSVAADQLHELTATFEALSEVLSESEAAPRIPAPAEEEQALLQRR